MANFCLCRKELERIEEEISEIEKMLKVLVLGMSGEARVSAALEEQIRRVAGLARKIDQKVKDL